MANWQESGNLVLPSHVPKYDLGLYGNSLMYKRQQYDAGVQKIEGMIESISGMPIIRDSDKQYLQEKVNNLRSTLNNMVGADWSSSRLVTEVGGLASQIAQDKRIQNAVISTKNIQSVQEAARKLKETHPERYTPQAEDYDNDQISGYLSNTDPDAKFGQSSPTEYYDYNKDITEALKQLHPSISYKIMEDGQFAYIYDKTTSITPAQIQEVVNGIIGTNPHYKRSVFLDARYTYKGIGSIDQMQQLVSQGVGNQVAQLERTNSELEALIAANEGNTNITLQYKDQISDNLNTINQLNKRMEGYNTMFQSGASLDDIKTTFLDDQVRNRYAIQFQRQDVERSIHENINAVKSYDFNFRANGQFLDYVKAGINPETRQPITPGDPLWTAYQNARKGPGESGEGSLTDDLPTTVSSDAYSDNLFSMGNLVTNMESATNAMKADQNLLKETYANKYHNTTFSAALEGSYKAWVAQQEHNLNAGLPVDQEYAKYKAMAQDKEIQLGVYQELITEAGKYASERVPDVPDIDDKDRAYVQGLEAERRRLLEDQSGPTSVARAKAIDGRLAMINRELKNSPAVKRARAIEKLQNEYLKQRAKALNSEGYAIPTDDKTQNKWRAYAVNAERDRQKRGKADDDDISIDPDKITVVRVDQDPFTQQPIIRYIYKGEGEFSQPIATTDPIFQGPVYSNLERMLNLSPRGKVEQTTSNGKLKYAVGKSKLGGYYAELIDGNKRYPVSPMVNQTNLVATSPSQFTEWIEQASRTINKNTGKPYTTQEIIELAKNNQLNF